MRPPTISKAYRAEQERLHTKPYGSSGHHWLGHIMEVCDALECKSVLDYGAGKATLGRYLPRMGISYHPYDPATYPKLPKAPCDLTVCLDVLEHVEQDYLPAVMTELYEQTTMALMVVVSTRPSSKTLSNGENAHITQHPYEWWKPQFQYRWRAVRVRQAEGSFEGLYLRSPISGKAKNVSQRVKILRGG